jgi:hypothetical protein
MNKTTLTTIASTMLAAVGGITTGAGYTSGDEVTAIVGGVVGLIGLVYAGISVYQRNTNKGGE